MDYFDNLLVAVYFLIVATLAVAGVAIVVWWLASSYAQLSKRVDKLEQSCIQHQVVQPDDNRIPQRSHGDQFLKYDPANKPRTMWGHLEKDDCNPTEGTVDEMQAEMNRRLPHKD